MTTKTAHPTVNFTYQGSGVATFATKVIQASVEQGYEFTEITGSLIDNYIIHLNGGYLSLDGDLQEIADLTRKNEYDYLILVEDFVNGWSSRYKGVLTNDSDHELLKHLNELHDQMIFEN